jgi:hypothetical protein
LTAQLGGILKGTMMEQQIEEFAFEGRPIKPHRSGGGQRVVVSGIGHGGLGIASMLAMVAAQGIDISIGGPNDPFEKREKPTNTGRRAEKDAAALAKAEAKRQRKMAKRATVMPTNVEVTGAARLYRAASVWTAGLCRRAIFGSRLKQHVLRLAFFTLSRSSIEVCDQSFNNRVSILFFATNVIKMFPCKNAMLRPKTLHILVFAIIIVMPC